MSGFTQTWLRLREKADHRSRNRRVLEALRQYFAGLAGVRVVDLGCGTGSNLRALRPYLPDPQVWRLVDHDTVLLEAARAALSASVGSGGLAEVAFEVADLAAGVESLLQGATDLVTAAAFFDLVSADWIGRFASVLAARRLALYAPLTYDGREHWLPAHSADPDVLAAFHAHQARDKGFGPSAGPNGAVLLASALHGHGYRLVAGPSPWRLVAGDQALIGELARGIAAAAAQTGLIAPAVVATWCAARVELGVTCEIGHVDVFATPPD